MKIGHGRSGLPILFRQFLAHLPQFCCFCHQKTDTGRDLCRYCQAHLPEISENLSQFGSTLCLQCGWQWPSTEKKRECVYCAKYQSVIKQIICPFRYDFPIDCVVGRLKYHHHLPSGRLLGSLLAAEALKAMQAVDFPDVFLPVPLNNQRYRQRGFNQALEIARSCGSELGIPVLAKSAGRHFDTGSLVGLSRAERAMRIRGAFWVGENLRGARVAIVDDVLTSGATSGELATELYDSGVSEIQLWVVARTPATGKEGGS